MSKKKLSESFDTFSAKVVAGVLMYADTEAKRLQNEMKSNAKWTDRTAHARQRLKGRAYQENPSTVVIKLSHGVDYGIFLEYAHEKKYAIIQPTIQANQYTVLQNFQYLLDKI